ncbi:MAG TPA: NAD(P)/FAD-dependent oxidoreductase [Pyrinomonadaceae bacterium]|nr:NAD(P)/FAD-dependent oxidoreductase [Pyrinomonadaceae bacterium]
MPLTSYDAIVVGAGPNGLTAAITLARKGYSVALLEANDTVGGSARSAESTLPGFLHDTCSAVHPLTAGSPYLSQLPLGEYGLDFINPPAALAHPFDDGTAALLYRSVDMTADGLRADAHSYKKLMEPLVASWEGLANDLLGPLRFPRHPIKAARFGLHGIRSAKSLVMSSFKEERTRALFAGLAAHSFLPLDRLATSAFALVLATLAHTVGWPIPKGGAQRISDALADYLKELGGEISTGIRVRSLTELPASRVVLCDVTPHQLLSIAGPRLPPGFRRRLQRYRYGPAAFKIDWALKGPVPWKAAECSQSATVHLGGSFEEISASESATWQGEHPNNPFLIVSQPTLFDPTRTPQGQHTLWAYGHVPNGSKFDMTERIEDQIERFAPGFRELILARNVMPPAKLEQHNANLVGGDINGGAQDLRQLFTRPTIRLYSTPLNWLYICSSSTPPGGGVHGMCGYHAALTAMRRSLEA